MNPRRSYTEEQRAAALAARGRMSVAVAAKTLGLPAGAVAKIWQTALDRGEVEPLATRRGQAGSPPITNRCPGRLRKAYGKAGQAVERGAP